MKIATNSDLANRKKGWIDFNAGRLVDDAISMETLADELLEKVIRIASGLVLTCTEVNGCREIAIFKDGVIN